METIHCLSNGQSSDSQTLASFEKAAFLSHTHGWGFSISGMGLAPRVFLRHTEVFRGSFRESILRQRLTCFTFAENTCWATSSQAPATRSECNLKSSNEIECERQSWWDGRHQSSPDFLTHTCYSSFLQRISTVVRIFISSVIGSWHCRKQQMGGFNF